MTRREKVIVLAMLAAVTYGGYSLLWAPEADKPVNVSGAGGQADLSAFAMDVVGKLKQLDPAGMVATVIGRGNAPWPASPFIQGPLNAEPQPTDAELASRPIPLRFTGFLQMGDAVLAIINGMEYEAGETLPDHGYQVKAISPGQVVLRQSGGKAEIILKLEDIQ